MLVHATLRLYQDHTNHHQLMNNTLHFLHTHRNTVFTLLTLCILVLGFLNFSPKDTTEVSNATSELEQNDIVVSLIIANKHSDESFTVSKGDTILDTLAILDEFEPEMQLGTKYYEGLGALVVSMYGLENGTDDQYWQYEIDGVMPQIGADAYKLQGGEEIKWKFTESAY